MSDYSSLCKDFISKNKSLLIAPAGYGKTYTISECLKHTNGLHLILTHTHAGVASLKEKIKNNGIPYDKYRVETIHSYAQKYVKAFYSGTDIPKQENQEYFPFIIKQATQLIKINPIKDIIKLTYTGLFVDEYQDCTKSQHEFIMVLAKILPIHILGDPLQGIFDFKEEIINFNNDLSEFEKFELNTPRRWEKTNPALGKCLKKIREKLENKEDIDLTNLGNAIEVISAQENDIFLNNGSAYNRKIWDLINENENILIIHPDSKNINLRLNLIKIFNNGFRLVEAIDDKDFYKFSDNFDKSTPNNIYKIVFDFMCNVFNKSEIKKWFNEKNIIKKRSLQDKEIIEPIQKDFEELKNSNNKISFVKVMNILKKISKLNNIKCYRKELFYDISTALEEAEYNGVSVYEAMINIKNRKRRMGKEIKGKCIGTTLLVKGLEFETVAVLNAHKFNDPKNFYVALTRASKRLIIFTNNPILSPYPKQKNN